MRIIPERCKEGQRLWARYAGLPSGRVRAAALIDWQSHKAGCVTCQRREAVEYEHAGAVPVIPWDVEGAK